MMFSPTVRFGIRLNDWNTSPIFFLRSSLSAESPRVFRKTPSTAIFPASTEINPAAAWRSVLFPEPLGPMTARKSPCSTQRERERSTLLPE